MAHSWWCLGEEAVVVQRIIRISFGWVCLVVGFLTFWLPLPTGLLLMALGVGMLLSASPTAVRVVHSWRVSWPVLDRWLTKLETVLPRGMKAGLVRTQVRLRSKLSEENGASPKPDVTEAANDQMPPLKAEGEKR